MSSPAVKMFKQQIERARNGDKASEAILREMVHGAANSAPLEDLLTVAECLAKIGEELSFKDEHTNGKSV